MAASDLTVLRSPDFPQVLKDAIDRAVSRIADRPELGRCDFEDEFFDCRKPATVHNLIDDMEYCARHFREVLRG